MKLSYKQKYQLLRNILMFLGLGFAYAKMIFDFFVTRGIIVL